MENNVNIPVTEDEEEEIFVTLTMDDNSTIECSIVTIFDFDERDYIVLLPLTEDGKPNKNGEVYIYRYTEDEEGNPSLENIDDDDEYEAVSDRFDECLLQDEEIFEEME